MLDDRTCDQTDGQAKNLFQPSAWIAPAKERPNRYGSALVSLADTLLASRFCSWRGLSGRRYVFSVYSPSDCPADCEAILVVAVTADAGRRQMISVYETGSFPEPIVARAQRELRAHGGGLEFHIHILASLPAARNATLADFAFYSDAKRKFVSPSRMPIALK